MKYLCLFWVGVFLLACKPVEEVLFASIQGETMGTTYHVKFQGGDPAEIKQQVDRLLYDINQGLSTYEKSSVISLFNKNSSDYPSLAKEARYAYFTDNFSLATEIYKGSNGAFEPTIMPIVNYWGFGYTGKEKVDKIDSLRVDSLLSYVGFSKLHIVNGLVSKSDLNSQLDFSAIAKGYGVDKVAQLLEENEILNYYVEIGGEVYARGVNDLKVKWRTGISVPAPSASSEDFQQIVSISGSGIATSGNYRNFYESNGTIYSHTINPKTGYPERTNLLSATIIGPSCAKADGYATACMVLGLEKSKELINLQEELEGILIYVDENQQMQVFDSTKK